MKVGIDGRSLRSSAARRGVGRYVRSLTAALARAFPEDRYALLVPGAPGAGMEELDAAGVEVCGTRVGSRPLFAAGVLTGRPRVDRVLGGCDVLLVPGVAPVASSPGVPLVLTVHDLTFEHRPGDFGVYDRVWHRVARPRRLARRAARVIAVSEAVRRELVAEWGLAPERVVSVPSGPGSRPGEPGRLPPGLPERFVLAVGALEPRKRPDLLVRAHARAQAAGLRAELVLAGDGPMREQLAKSHARVLGFVPDDVLHALYKRALALACVSREEGFSFTPLEAVAHGTPAVVSDLPVFDETVAGGALRVPGGDETALADALLRLERDRSLREQLVSAGRQALGRLSWEQAAIRTRAVLHDAAEAA